MHATMISRTRPTLSALAARPASGIKPLSAVILSRRSAVRASALSVGDVLPDFELETDASTSSNKVTLKSKDLVADSGAVIFVYPQACTSGCTFQANGFKDASAEFQKAGYKIYGLSADSPSAQAGWKKEHGLNYPLLCDPTKEALGKLGCLDENKSIKRAHFVVAKGGKVEDVKHAVGSKDSVPLALAFATSK